MFKDYDKYLYTSINVYLFVLVITFIMKLVGLDYFGLDLNNPMLLELNKFVGKFYLENVWYAITLFLNVYITISLTCNVNNKSIKKYCLLLMPLIILIQYSKNYTGFFAIIIDYAYLFIISLIYLKFKKIKINKYHSFNYLVIMLINTFVQMFSMIIRNQELSKVTNNFCVNVLLNIDYFIIIIIIHKMYFLKGGTNLCQMVVSYGLQKLTNLKDLQRKLLKRLQNKPKQRFANKVEENTYKIYLFLYILWNLLTLVIILIIARLNNTTEECIFIIFGFLITKRVFGKAFHLKNVFYCFILSNLTYYFLNRITTPLGISIFIPITLGVGLSYFTSKLVKKSYKPLYKGMPKELFDEIILKVVDKDSDKYKICYDYFINKQSALYLSGKYNYSEAGIRKIKDRVNEKIKKLD